MTCLFSRVLRHESFSGTRDRGPCHRGVDKCSREAPGVFLALTMAKLLNLFLLQFPSQ